MPYDSQAIQELQRQLQILMDQAAKASRFLDVIPIATALEALKTWQEGGGIGDLPAAVQEVKGINLPAVVETPAEPSNGAPAQGQQANSEAASKLDPHLLKTINVQRNTPVAEPARDALEQLNSIQRRLSEIRFDLRQINEARWVVEGFRYDKSINDAGRLPEVELLLKQLNEMREEAQRRSDGGASSELSGDYERAFTVFRNALRDGYRVIADDRTGETIEVEPSLMRVREKYFQQQIELAKAYLTDGDPEVAVSRLSKALTLLQPVESPDGIKWRAEVNKLLDQAKQEQEAKQQANQLVDDTHKADEQR